jgi:hypothetical protein
MSFCVSGRSSGPPQLNVIMPPLHIALLAFRDEPAPLTRHGVSL